MIPELPKVDRPEWLEKIFQGDEPRELPLADMLKDSLYYPACGLNGTPVKFLAGNVLSFVYADYGITKRKYFTNLNGRGRNCGFKGYHSILQREIFRDEIVPAGWVSPIIPPEERMQRVMRAEERADPFGHWSVWARDDVEDDDAGPECFSFFYLCGEMSAVYQGLYTRLSIAPKMLSIIQPGAMGGEWEGVAQDDSFFRRVVQSNPLGMPKYLIYGGFGRDFYKEACWEEYKGARLVQLPERYAGIWELRQA